MNHQKHPSRQALLLGSLNNPAAPVLMRIRRLIHGRAVVITSSEMSPVEKTLITDRAQRTMDGLGIPLDETCANNVCTLIRQVHIPALIIPDAPTPVLAHMISSIRYNLRDYTQHALIIAEGRAAALISRGTQAVDYIGHPTPESPDTDITSLEGIRITSADIVPSSTPHLSDEKIQAYLRTPLAGKNLFVVAPSAAVLSTTDIQGISTYELLGEVREHTLKNSPALQTALQTNLVGSSVAGNGLWRE